MIPLFATEPTVLTSLVSLAVTVLVICAVKVNNLQVEFHREGGRWLQYWLILKVTVFCWKR